MLRNIFLFAVIVTIVFCAGCIIYAIGSEMHKLTLRYEISKLYVRVYKKEYKEEQYTFMPVEDMIIPQTTQSAQYNIFFIYNREIYCINNKHLYSVCDKNDVIPVYMHRGYNKKGVLKDIFFDVQ